MKKTIILSFLLALSLFAKADNVLKVNGELVEKYFVYMEGDFEKPGNMLVGFSDGSIVSYSMNRMEVLPNDILIDGIDQKTAESGFFSIKRAAHDVLSLEGAEAGEAIAIYSSTGALVLRDKCSGEHHNVNISALSSGIYILQVGKKAIKFNKE